MTPWGGPVNWASMTHPQLHHAATADSEPAAAYELGRDWAALGADMVDQAQALAKRIAATEGGWQGAAAESVRAATVALTRWCGDAGAGALAVGECLAEQAAAVEAAKVRMPEPVDFDWDATLGSFAGAGDPVAAVSDVRALSERARAALERAVDVMTELERWCERIDGEIPGCPPPPGPPGGGGGGATGPGDVGALPGAGAPPAGDETAVPPAGDGTAAAPVGADEHTSAAGVTGGVAGAAEPDLARFGGAGTVEGGAGGPGLSAAPAVPPPGARTGAAPADGARGDLPAQGGPGGGRGTAGIGGSGVVGAPGGARARAPRAGSASTARTARRAFSPARRCSNRCRRPPR